MTEHKNAKWVKMFVEGKPIQWKMAGIDGAYHTWELVTSLQQFDDQGLMFRAKPEVRKCVGYRRYFYKRTDKIFTGWIYEAGSFFSEADIEDDTDFIKWLDKEWQYHEVEVSE